MIFCLFRTFCQCYDVSFIPTVRNSKQNNIYLKGPHILSLSWRRRDIVHVSGSCTTWFGSHRICSSGGKETTNPWKRDNIGTVRSFNNCIRRHVKISRGVGHLNHWHRQVVNLIMFIPIWINSKCLSHSRGDHLGSFLKITYRWAGHHASGR
jgi:hypothetical protein